MAEGGTKSVAKLLLRQVGSAHGGHPALLAVLVRAAPRVLKVELAE